MAFFGGLKRGFLASPSRSSVAAPLSADPAARALRAVAVPLDGTGVDPFAALLSSIAASKARVVLIGEASHGTHDMYAFRAVRAVRGSAAR